MATMKTLLIRPADVSLRPLGGSSPVADVQVSVSYDRDVAVDGGLYAAGGVPFVATSIPVEGLRVAVLANDDPSITSGAGFGITVDLLYLVRRGFHGQDVRKRRTVIITSISDDTVALGDAAEAVQLPPYISASDLTGIVRIGDYLMPVTPSQGTFIAVPKR